MHARMVMKIEYSLELVIYLTGFNNIICHCLVHSAKVAICLSVVVNDRDLQLIS